MRCERFPTVATVYEMREDAEKKEEHLYPVINPAALGFSTLLVSPV